MILTFPSRPAEWPLELLDVNALLRTGWRPLPFRQFILKVHSRCNLACDYCYVYRSADQGWQDQPVRMSEAIVARTVERIAEHVRAHNLPAIQVVLHGGEPLLAGPHLLAFLATRLRSALPEDTQADLYVQTNGTLIDEAMIAVLHEHGVRVGVSLDGDAATTNASRYYLGGRGSHAQVVQGLEWLREPQFGHLFAGILCVIAPHTDPIAVYEHLILHGPPTIDFLLPHANWSHPPPTRSDVSSTPFGDWLIAVFDRWYFATQRETSIRLFEEIIRGILGQSSRVDSIGLSPARQIVVETDGSIQRTDALKSVYNRAGSTNMHVSNDAFDAALLDPHLIARQIGVEALSDVCKECEVRDVCGGGFYPHRYRRGLGFRNPSVYCNDLFRLIQHVHSRVKDDLTRHRMLIEG